MEVKLFNKSPELFYGTNEYFLKNYFRFLDDVKYSWKENIEFSPLWELMNSLDHYIKFISKHVSTAAIFLDVLCSIKGDQFIFDIYQKPTHLFVYLHYNNCHLEHTKIYYFVTGTKNYLNSFRE